MKKELEGKYVVVTMVSSFRQRYVVPTEALQELNENFDLDENEACVWAHEEVMQENVKEFSQHWLGEEMIDTDIVDENKILEIFKKDNPYLDDWDDEKKIKFIRDWKEKDMKNANESL